MKIVDLRPALVRRWQAADRSPPRAPWPAGVWARAVDVFMARRAGRRGVPPRGMAVVSVGNLALGGTGKTPVTMALARDLSARGQGGIVLTRGYGSSLRGPLAVRPDDERTGDEARLMAATLAATGWSVVQARDRVAGLSWLQDRSPAPETVILEDGHQNAAPRRLDVLILDRWLEENVGGETRLAPESGPVAPWGPWRETARGAGRADVLLVEAETPPARSVAGQPVLGFVRRLRLDRPVSPGTPWLCVSGIARPEAFEAEATAVLGGRPRTAVRCRDHEPYGQAVRELIHREITAAGGVLVVTTAKDWVKLRRRWPVDLPVAVADQELVWTGKKALPELVGERLDACRG